MKSLAILVLSTAAAAAEPSVTIAPAAIHPGDPVVVSVADPTAAPRGKAGGLPLVFFPAKAGYQAVFAIPLDVKEDHILVELAGAKPLSIPILQKKFAETKLAVEEELANPSKVDGELIDADNRAIGEVYAKAIGAPQFTRAFRRPPGAMTSPFGEWRTFNDLHRAQHVGLDLAAREGARVVAINDGAVTLVRETFLAGNVVVIAHGGGISSLYFHLSKPSVVEGDVVKQGQEIGRAGHTGRTTGPHLHVSIHVPGGMVDPVAFLRLRLAPMPPAA